MTKMTTACRISSRSTCRTSARSWGTISSRRGGGRATSCPNDAFSDWHRSDRCGNRDVRLSSGPSTRNPTFGRRVFDAAEPGHNSILAAKRRVHFLLDDQTPHLQHPSSFPSLLPGRHQRLAAERGPSSGSSGIMARAERSMVSSSGAVGRCRSSRCEASVACDVARIRALRQEDCSRGP